jgi:hypothetical protein
LPTSLTERFSQALDRNDPRRRHKWRELLPFVAAERAKGRSVRAIAAALSEVGYPISWRQLYRRLAKLETGKTLCSEDPMPALRSQGLLAPKDDPIGLDDGPQIPNVTVEQTVCRCGRFSCYGDAGIFSIISLPQAGHPMRWYVCSSQCARDAGWPLAATLLEAMEAASIWPVECDVLGSLLPAWRSRELRSGTKPSPEEIESTAPAVYEPDYTPPAPLPRRRLRRLLNRLEEIVEEYGPAARTSNPSA